MDFLFTRRFNHVDAIGLMVCANLSGWFWLLTIPLAMLSILGERAIASAKAGA